MQVVNPRSALLSNYEVLKLLKERDTAQTVHARAALVKKEDTDEKPPLTDVASLVGQNVRTVQFEAIAHLSSPPLRTTRQDEKMIVKLMKALRPYTFTKLEKLQIVNLLPTSLVELYVIVEDLEERFSEEDMQQILQIVASSIMVDATGLTDDVKSDNITADEPENAVDIGEEDWAEDAGDAELLDGPRYGEFEDDLGGEGMDDDDD